MKSLHPHRTCCPQQRHGHPCLSLSPTCPSRPEYSSPHQRHAQATTLRLHLRLRKHHCSQCGRQTPRQLDALLRYRRPSQAAGAPCVHQRTAHIPLTQWVPCPAALQTHVSDLALPKGVVQEEEGCRSFCVVVGFFVVMILKKIVFFFIFFSTLARPRTCLYIVLGWSRLHAQRFTEYTKE
jgi:hypothetical protein